MHKNNSFIQKDEKGEENAFNENISYDKKYQSSKEFFDDKFSKGIESTCLTPDLNGNLNEGRLENITEIIEARNIDDFCNKHHISKNTLLLACTVLALNKFTFTKNTLITILCSDPDDTKVKAVPFIISNEDREVSIIDFIKAVDETLKTTIENSTYPYTKIAEEYQLNNEFLYSYDESAAPEFNISKEEDSLSCDYKTALFITNLKENFELKIEYNNQLYSEDYIHIFANSIKSILNQFLSCDVSKFRICDVSLQSERKMPEFNEVELPFIHKRFEKQVSETPDDVAIVACDATLTYKQLNEKTNIIANALIDNGIKPKSNVLVMLPRESNLIASILAILKVGCAFIPIDPEYPQERINYIYENSHADYIIAEKSGKNSLSIDELLCNGNAENPNVKIEPDDLAYIIYTSGSTGKPKGVMISHKGMCNQITGNPMKNFDSILTISTISFIMSIRDILTGTTNGIKLIFASDSEVKNIHDLVELINNTQPEAVTMTPSRFLSYLEINEFCDSINCFKAFIMGGEAFPAKKFDSIEKYTDAVIFNAYGQSEGNFLFPVPLEKMSMDSSNITVGKPLENSTADVRDIDRKMLPEGVMGELYFGGPSIAKGYYNLDQTKDVFVEINGIPYINTEDFAVKTPEGEFIYKGRKDDQIKLSGQRIELGEIIAVINQYPGILDNVVTIKEIHGFNHLIAYYVAKNKINESDLENYLKSILPKYMIPSVFMEIEEIPKNVNGKVDVLGLPEPSSNNAQYEAPGNEKEEVVVNAFKQLFGGKIGVNDEFLILGGTSLAAIQILKYLKGYYITATDILQLRTPKKIAENLKKTNICLDKYSFDDEVILSESQLSIYLDEMINDMGTGYNNPFKIEFNDRYSKDEIKNALIKLFDLHPILKTRLVESKDQFVSCVFDAEIKINQGKLSDIKSFVRPFELNKNLSRFLIASDGESTTLCCDIHHMIFDGTSMNILINTLFSILDNVNTDSVDNGILRQVAFEENIDSNYFNDAQKFYDMQLADRDEVQDLLSCVDGDDGFEYNHTFEIDIKHLSSFLHSNAITHNHFFASIFAYTISRFTGSYKVLFNLVTDGRGHIDLSDSVGMFAKTLPLLMDCKNQKVSSFFKYSSQLINFAMKYDLYPFRTLKHEYDLNNNILFQYSHDIFKNDVCVLKHDLQRDMTFSIYNVDEEKMGIKILYSNQFSKEFIKRFTDSYILILNEIMNVKELSDINFTVESDLILLDSYNHNEDSLMYGDVLDAFNENLSRYPNNKLVSYKDVSYSYGESAFIADKIARKLTELGVKSNSNIGFLVPRSELYMLSVLSILSVGAVYVPLDDSLPDERIKFMMNDTKTGVIIVSDETYEHASNLASDCTILNVSDIIKGKISTLSRLPVVYGDLACVLYTSGTTDVPKGVKITRKAILNFVEYYVNESNMDNDAIYGLFASIGFDVAIKGIFSSIYSGACLNIIPEDIKLNMDKLNKYFDDYGVTHTHITTQVAKLFINSCDEIPLTELVTGGEKLGEIVNPPNCRFVDTYGPTEACVYVTSIDEEEKIASSSVGHLLNNMKAYILDNNLNRVPCGAVGELFLSGYQIADGYLNRDEETKNTFLNNPFEDNEDYNIMYRTGDMARFLPDGSLAIVGRRDSQVKIRGNRVELSEVEAVIRQIDYIDDVSVQPIRIGENNELVAYVVVSGEIENLKEDIQNYVGMNKPDYMVPFFVIQLDEIPLTVNGKVDKNRLPKPDVSTKNSAPQNSKEKELLELCQEVGDNKNFGVDDNLASLGISSLELIDLNHRIYSKFNINISYLNLMRCRNVRDIYNLLNKNEQNVFKKYEKRKYYPLTENQILVSRERIENPAHLKLNFTVKIKYVDVFSLKKSFIKFFDKHPFLKSTLMQNEGEYYLKREDDADISDLINIDRKSKKEFDLFVKKLDNDSEFLENYLEEGYTRYGSKFFYCKLTEYENTVFAAILFDHLAFDYYSLYSMLNEIDKIYSDEEDKIEPEIIDGFDYNMFFVNDEKKNSSFNSECKKEIFDYGDLYIPPVRQEEINPYQRSILMYVFNDKKYIQEYCKKFNIKYNRFFLVTFALTMFKFYGLKKGFVPVTYNGRIFEELKNTYHCTVKPIFLKMEMYKWNCLDDAFLNISDEMTRIFKTEPNTLYLYYDNQWIFNFIKNSEYNFNLDISDYKQRVNTSKAIKKDHENILNEVLIFENEDFYMVNMSYLDKYYTEEYITEFLNCWSRIIGYIISQGDLKMPLDFKK